MTLDELKQRLRYTLKKHENDKVPTGNTNIAGMCKDILYSLDDIIRNAKEEAVAEYKSENEWSDCDNNCPVCDYGECHEYHEQSLLDYIESRDRNILNDFLKFTKEQWLENYRKNPELMPPKDKDTLIDGIAWILEQAHNDFIK